MATPSVSAENPSPSRPSDDTVRQWLMDNYGLDGELTQLPGDCDQNYKLSTTDGTRYVCKLTHGQDGCDLLSAQNDVMVKLAESDLAAIPKVLTSQQGQMLVPFDEDYLGRVLTYVPGKVLHECAPYSKSLLRNLGHTIGQLDHALTDFDHAALHYKFDWDLAHATEPVERHRGLITDPALRDQIDQTYDRFQTIVVPKFGELRKSVIHNDANDYNVLAEGDKVTGLIDFSDMVYTHTICDLAISMAYTTLEAEDVTGVIVEMARGFHAAMPISSSERKVLLPMMCMRLAVSACMAAHQSRLRPDDPYLLISQEPIRRTLPKLLALDPGEVDQLLNTALA